MTRPPRPPRASKREGGVVLWAWHRVGSAIWFAGAWMETTEFHELYRNTMNEDGFLCQKCSSTSYEHYDIKRWVKVRTNDLSIVWSIDKRRAVPIPEVRTDDVVNEKWDRFRPST